MSLRIFVFLLALCAVLNATQYFQHNNQSMPTNGPDTNLMGEEILMKGNYTLVSIGRYPGATPTTCYVKDTTGAITYATGSFVGNNCSVDIALNQSSSYWIYVDSGGAGYTYHQTNACGAACTNISDQIINWTSGVYAGTHNPTAIYVISDLTFNDTPGGGGYVPTGPDIYSPLNNSIYYLNASRVNFTYGAKNSSTTSITGVLDGAGVFGDNNVPPFPKNVSYYITFNLSGTHNFLAFADGTDSGGPWSNASGTYYFNISDAVNLYLPTNAFYTSSSDITLKYGVYTGGNGYAETYINGILMDNRSLTNTQNVTLYYVFPSGTYNWSVHWHNTTANASTFYSSTYTFSILNTEAIFNDCINATLTGCNSTIKSSLVSCECYRLTKIYNFSMIACPNTNVATNYTCIGANASFYKNNWSMFYTPASWVYADNTSGQQHSGAIYYYGTSALNPGVAMLNSTRFVFIPAQNRERDCNITYTTTGPCSWGNGFILNDREMIVSDRQGVFYTAGGLGITVYNETQHGNMTVNIQVVPLDFWTKSVFGTGIYLKQSCLPTNGTFNIYLVNTMEKNWLVQDTNGTSYASSGKLLIYSLPIQNGTNITVTADGEYVCGYYGSSNLFMNLDLSFIPLTILGYLTKLFAIAMIAISSVIPLFLFGFIIFNDLFHPFTVFEAGILCGFCIVGSVVLNSTSFERTIKHVILLFAIFIAYVVVLSPWHSAVGVSLTDVTQLTDSFSAWGASNTPWDMAYNTISVIINLFMILLRLPALAVGLFFALLRVISPAIGAGIAPMEGYLALGITVALYVKAFEVISNRFRPV